jgi:CheY-like chemotaxis protein
METNGQKTALVADDDPDVLELRKMFLELEGFIVYTADRGDTAIAQLYELKKQYPGGMDVLLVDGQMPGANGDEVIGAYFLEFPGARTLAVMSTGSQDPKFHAQARAMGAHAVFVKGDNSRLIEAILNPQMYLQKAP